MSKRPRDESPSPDRENESLPSTAGQLTSSASLVDDRASKRPRGRPSRAESPPRETNVLGAFGLSNRTDERVLEKTFGEHGQVEKAVLIRDKKTKASKRFAFITMASIEDARRARDALRPLTLDGREVRVDFSKTTRPHSPTPGEYMGVKTDELVARAGRRRGGGGGGNNNSNYHHQYQEKQYPPYYPPPTSSYPHPNHHPRRPLSPSRRTDYVDHHLAIVPPPSSSSSRPIPPHEYYYSRPPPPAHSDYYHRDYYDGNHQHSYRAPPPHHRNWPKPYGDHPPPHYEERPIEQWRAHYGPRRARSSHSPIRRHRSRSPERAPPSTSTRREISRSPPPTRGHPNPLYE